MATVPLKVESQGGIPAQLLSDFQESGVADLAQDLGLLPQGAGSAPPQPPSSHHPSSYQGDDGGLKPHTSSMYAGPSTNIPGAGPGMTHPPPSHPGSTPMQHPQSIASQNAQTSMIVKHEAPRHHQPSMMGADNRLTMNPPTSTMPQYQQAPPPHSVAHAPPPAHRPAPGPAHATPPPPQQQQQQHPMSIPAPSYTNSTTNLPSVGPTASMATAVAAPSGTATSGGGATAHQDDTGDGTAESADQADGKRKRRPVRTADRGKGLRHFSMKVCEKVESKGRTTYNEVADELVMEFTAPEGSSNVGQDQQYDEKNIRRRVYDALNVLMAMDIISKEKKEIKWKGLPPSSASHQLLTADAARVRSRVEKKAGHLQELKEQMAGIERLMRRNEVGSRNGGLPPGGGVALPFILVQTRPQATVEVEISEDMQLVHFDFSSTPFELHDDSYVLRAMGLCASPLDDVFPPSPSPTAPKPITALGTPTPSPSPSPNAAGGMAMATLGGLQAAVAPLYSHQNNCGSGGGGMGGGVAGSSSNINSSMQQHWQQQQQQQHQQHHQQQQQNPPHLYPQHQQQQHLQQQHQQMQQQHYVPSHSQHHQPQHPQQQQHPLHATSPLSTSPSVMHPPPGRPPSQQIPMAAPALTPMQLPGPVQFAGPPRGPEGNGSSMMGSSQAHLPPHMAVGGAQGGQAVGVGSAAAPRPHYEQASGMPIGVDGRMEYHQAQAVQGQVPGQPQAPEQGQQRVQEEQKIHVGQTGGVPHQVAPGPSANQSFPSQQMMPTQQAQHEVQQQQEQHHQQQTAASNSDQQPPSGPNAPPRSNGVMQGAVSPLSSGGAFPQQPHVQQQQNQQQQQQLQQPQHQQLQPQGVRNEQEAELAARQPTPGQEQQVGQGGLLTHSQAMKFQDMMEQQQQQQQGQGQQPADQQLVT